MTKQRQLFITNRKPKAARRHSLALFSEQYTEDQLEYARLVIAGRNKYRGFLLIWARSFLKKHEDSAVNISHEQS